MKLFVRLPALALAAILVACSGGTPKASVPPTPTNDAGRARLLLLTQVDMPPGWRASRHRSDPVSDREDKKLAACIGAPDPARSVSADVFGDVFGQGAQTIASEVVFSRTTALATKAVAALKGRRVIPCATAAVRPVIAEQLKLRGLSATIRSVAVTRRVVAVKGVVTAFRVVANLTAAGAAITVQEDIVILARGRAQVRATFVDVGVAFPSGLELFVVKKLSGKLFHA
ncbi:MAG: hypothetical protein E6G04_03850 [Actinobacteria bacterium]|nr:MAG: hypothetical protein E6G04_03850 [Actinomycetota bacterium]